jgi:bacterioferritin
MANRTDQPLLDLLNQALARELQVSVQYMLQHGVAAGRQMLAGDDRRPDPQTKFVASNSFYWFPGVTLKKIAIAEMRHAEAISKRIVVLGGEPTTEPDAITIGETVPAMLTDDREQEEGAIALYTHIVEVADSQGDDVTRDLFRRILSEEHKHHQAFSGLLALSV